MNLRLQFILVALSGWVLGGSAGAQTASSPSPLTLEARLALHKTAREYFKLGNISDGYATLQKAVANTHSTSSADFQLAMVLAQQVSILADEEGPATVMAKGAFLSSSSAKIAPGTLLGLADFAVSKLAVPIVGLTDTQRGILLALAGDISDRILGDRMRAIAFFEQAVARDPLQPLAGKRLKAIKAIEDQAAAKAAVNESLKQRAAKN